MNHLAKLALPTLLLSTLAAQDEHHYPPTVELTLHHVGASIELRLANPMPEFLGMVVVNLDNETMDAVVGLPPMLANAAVLAFGSGNDGEFVVSRSLRTLPLGVAFYAQGVVADTWGLRSSHALEVLVALPER